jgi:transposase
VAAIARAEGVSEPTVRKYLKKQDFSPKPPLPKERPSLLDPYKPYIENMLDEDSRTWHKQHHTASKIYQRLRDEHGYEGSYTTVQQYVKRRKEERGQDGGQYLELVWHPGEMQVDFGQTETCCRGAKTREHALVASFPQSNVGLAQVMPGETAECVCEGLIAIFERIGGVPLRIVFDNATGVGRKVGGIVRTSALFQAFAAHYGFEYSFCNPYAGHEKGSVENKVGAIRRDLFVPTPRVANMPRFNESLLERCLARSEKEHYSKGVRELDLFEVDLAALHPLPYSRFEAVTYERMRCDKYGKVCLEGRHRYSTSPEYGCRDVIVGRGAFKVVIVSTEGEPIAEHERAYGDAPTESTDPSAQLALLCAKQNGWRNSEVRESLPELLREALDSMDKASRGSALRCLRDVAAESGYGNAVAAADQVLAALGAVDPDSVGIVARLAADGREPVAYDQEVGLSEYDFAFAKEGGLGA